MRVALQRSETYLGDLPSGEVFIDDREPNGSCYVAMVCEKPAALNTGTGEVLVVFLHDGRTRIYDVGRRVRPLSGSFVEGHAL